MDIRYLASPLIFLASALLLSSCYSPATLPSYKEQKETYLKEKMSQPSPFSTEDLQVMKRSGDKLAKNFTSPGLKINSKAPDFRLQNAFGKYISLADTLKNGPVILVFYRGAWCPFCNLHLHALHKSVEQFSDYNAQLIAITPQQPDKSLAQLQKDQFNFEVLSDLDNSVMQAYNMLYKLDEELVKVYKKHGLDIEAFNGKDRTSLPVPGTFIIDQNGIIRGVHADVDYMQRMEPADIIDILKTL